MGHGSVDHQDPRYLTTSKARRNNHDIPIPVASPRWHATAQSWFNALKISGHTVFFEASDWATAVAAAEMYDRFLRTDNASILAQFVRMSERLGCTEIDRKRARIELTDAEVKDVDRERAASTVISWRHHLGVVRDTG
jgi:hypothetical protein